MPKPPVSLSVVRASRSKPRRDVPANLGAVGARLWRSIQREYQIVDSGGREILMQACAAGERAELCAQRIATDGMVIESKSGARDHPLLRHEAAARALCCRLLTRLGINIEPTKRVGRPATGIGISWEDLPDA